MSTLSNRNAQQQSSVEQPAEDVSYQSTTSSPTKPKKSLIDIAAIILRKILFLHPQQEQPVITVLKDVIIGTVVGVFILLFLIFLDYRNIIPLRSARGLHQSMSKLLSDPETIESIEEGMDRKFMHPEVYNEKVREINLHETAVAEMIKYGLSRYEKELEEMNYEEEMAKLTKERDELDVIANKLVGLDDWCGSCRGGWGNCDARVAFLKQQYGTGERQAKVDIMKSKRCIRPGATTFV